MSIIPPAILDMRVPRADGEHVRLWLPVFLLWPLVWILELVMLVPAAVLDVVLWLVGREYHRYALLLLNTFGLLGDMRGLAVRIAGPTADIDMTFT